MVRRFDAGNTTDDALLAYNDMMVECFTKVENFASLAIEFWTEALKELVLRGRVKLVSGSFDDPGNARTIRMR